MNELKAQQDTARKAGDPQPCTCSRRSDFLPFHEFALTRPSARSRKKSQVPPEWLYAALEMVLDWITKPGPQHHASTRRHKKVHIRQVYHSPGAAKFDWSSFDVCFNSDQLCQVGGSNHSTPHSRSTRSLVSSLGSSPDTSRC